MVWVGSGERWKDEVDGSKGTDVCGKWRINVCGKWREMEG